MSVDISTAGDEWQAEFFGGLFDETLVGIAAASTELVVEMGDGEPPMMRGSEAGEQVQ